jgi:hypothetical protein
MDYNGRSTVLLTMNWSFDSGKTNGVMIACVERRYVKNSKEGYLYG